MRFILALLAFTALSVALPCDSPIAMVHTIDSLDVAAPVGVAPVLDMPFVERLVSSMDAAAVSRIACDPVVLVLRLDEALYRDRDRLRPGTAPLFATTIQARHLLGKHLRPLG